MENKQNLSRIASFSIFLMFLFLIFTSSLASAKEFIVDDDSKADFASIQEAVNNSAPGDRILVLPGTYNERVNIGIQNISIFSKSENPKNTFVMGFNITNNHILISGFTIQESVLLFGDPIAYRTGNTVRNNIFLNDGLHISECDSSVFDKNIFEKGSSIYSDCHFCIFSDNIFFEGNFYLNGGQTSTNSLILNNTFFKGGIELAGSSDNKIIKNKISSGTDDGYGVVWESSVSFPYSY